MAMTKVEKAKAARMTREDVEATLREICLATARRDEAAARMEEELTLVRERFETSIADQAAAVKEGEERLQAWADAHPEAFASQRSVAMLHGTLGYRTGLPTLKTLRGVTWERVIALLKQNELAHYVVVKESPDKDGLIGDREMIGDDGLRALGMRIDQAERFFVRPNKESIGKGGGS